MKVIPLRHHADVRFAQTLAHQFGLSTAHECVEQLVEQFAAFRRERAQQFAALRAEFDRDTAEHALANRNACAAHRDGRAAA